MSKGACELGGLKGHRCLEVRGRALVRASGKWPPFHTRLPTDQLCSSGAPEAQGLLPMGPPITGLPVTRAQRGACSMIVA